MRIGHRHTAANSLTSRQQDASEMPAPPAAPVAMSVDEAPQRAGTRRATAALALATAALLGSGLTLGAQAFPHDQTTGPDSAGGTGAAAAPATDNTGAADGPDTGWAAVASTVSPGVVAIAVEGESGSGEGSGVVWDTQGDIVTNNHVVSSVGPDARITVRMGAQDTYTATVKGTDPSADLAVIRLDDPPANLTPVAQGSSRSLHVGDPVMALGNPLGLSGTVTTGIVSALERPVATSEVPSPGIVPSMSVPTGDNQPVVTDAIQTNAAINPGNSGGALVDSAGRLVGINSSIASLGGSGDQGGNIGIGFAIPIETVAPIVHELVTTGHASVPFLGAGITDATVPEKSAQVSGAGITSVEQGAPAATAGLQTGDVITALDGQPVDGATSLVGKIRAGATDRSVTLTVHRGGNTQDIAVTLQAKSN